MSRKLEYHGTLVDQHVKAYRYGTMSICVSRAKRFGTIEVEMKADKHMLIVSFATALGQPYDDALIEGLLPQLGMKADREIRLYPNLVRASLYHNQTRYYIQVQADIDSGNDVIDA